MCHTIVPLNLNDDDDDDVSCRVWRDDTRDTRENK